MERLDLLRLEIADRLCDIEDLLPSDYKLTLVARHATNPDAHIIVTVDDSQKVVEAIHRTDKAAFDAEIAASRAKRDAGPTCECGGDYKCARHHFGDSP